MNSYITGALLICVLVITISLVVIALAFLPQAQLTIELLDAQ